MSDLVKMTHPELGEAGPVTRHAFETVWGPKGWTLVEDDKTISQPARRSRAQTTKEQQ